MTRTARMLSLLLAVFAIAAVIAPAANAGGAFFIIQNESFEADPAEGTNLTPWKRAHNSGDRIACGDKAPGAPHGQCAFMFRGGANERTSLAQKAGSIDIMNATLPYGPGSVDLSFTSYSKSAATKLHAGVKVKYTLPGSSEVIVARSSVLMLGASIDGGAPAWVETVVQPSIVIPQGATVVSAKVNFKNLSPRGKVFIDEVYAVFVSGS